MAAHAAPGNTATQSAAPGDTATAQAGDMATAARHGAAAPEDSTATASWEAPTAWAAAAPPVGYDGPEHATARELVRQGRDYVARREEESAIRRFTEALVLDPAYGPAYAELGAARERTGDIEEAQRVYDRGIAYAPRFAGTYLARGALRERMGQPGQALTDFETAFRLGGADANSLHRMAPRDASQRAWPAALAKYRRLATLAGSSQEAQEEHDAWVQAAALSILCGELDPVRAGARGRGWVRAAMASAARRRGQHR